MYTDEQTKKKRRIIAIMLSIIILLSAGLAIEISLILQKPGEKEEVKGVVAQNTTTTPTTIKKATTTATITPKPTQKATSTPTPKKTTPTPTPTYKPTNTPTPTPTNTPTPTPTPTNTPTPTPTPTNTPTPTPTPTNTPTPTPATLPDLIVSQVTITENNYLVVKVTNMSQGSGYTGITCARLYSASLSNEFHLECDEGSVAIGGGNTYTWTFKGLSAYAPYNIYKIVAIADNNGTVQELDENNNTKTYLLPGTLRLSR